MDVADVDALRQRETGRRDVGLPVRFEIGLGQHPVFRVGGSQSIQPLGKAVLTEGIAQCSGLDGHGPRDRVDVVER
ncbi:hypothetical protein [Sphingomonas kyungheensis]|uniref:Uncharacterized protein n=1 Tax=Sphingomonas kyungheensis TaxID=1069987 RepID=A0ABU8GZ27_9SPHN